MPVRVAMLNPCFWPEVRRGAERILHGLGVGLIERGHDVRLITAHAGPANETVEAGLPVRRHRRPPEPPASAGFEDYLSHLPLAARALRGEDPEVAEAFFPTDALVATRWGRRTGRPAIFYAMGIPVRQYLVARRGRLEMHRRVLAECAAVVALSRTAARAFAEALGVDARVIHPGVDLDAFSPGGERDEHPTILCTAAADVPRKRVPLLVEAFALLRRRRPDARLLLVRPGDATVAHALESRADGIEWLDQVAEASALAPAYRRAWVSVLPSVGDSFGVVLAESLACGTPVVGSDEGAIPEVIDRPEIGQCFSGDAPEALAEALEDTLELALDPAAAPACRARAGDFSLERAVDAHEALFAELLGDRPG